MRTRVSTEYRVMERAPLGPWEVIAVAYVRNFAIDITILAASDSPETWLYECHAYTTWSDGTATGECVWMGRGRK